DETEKKIIRVEEKPKVPKSNFAQTGFYLFDARIFSVIKELKPSHRCELEITDAVNKYIEWGELAFSHVKGFWSDAGTFDTLLRAGNFASEQKQTSDVRHHKRGKMK
ncbi:MAG: sugar phosphate nucleotidyltransferase, partial [Patescibacteria group bacterium]